MNTSSETEKLAVSKYDKLVRFSPELVNARLVLQRDRHGNYPELQATLTIGFSQGQDIVVRKRLSENHVADPLPTLVRIVFQVAMRKLKNMQRRARQDEDWAWQEAEMMDTTPPWTRSGQY
jgi:hypothetical protein